ncbi:unnamed protein product [Protopolystoma xenopodis]|uniref:Uncharacterized protein n=1 Tax=Protopolystoma xenopodis TaxID=117903 RepID=A0A3S5ALJ8_9PLAT|nr:unnamed protein product [Protopolystoma xenopodis]
MGVEGPNRIAVNCLTSVYALYRPFSRGHMAFTSVGQLLEVRWHNRNTNRMSPLFSPTACARSEADHFTPCTPHLPLPHPLVFSIPSRQCFSTSTHHSQAQTLVSASCYLCGWYRIPPTTSQPVTSSGTIKDVVVAMSQPPCSLPFITIRLRHLGMLCRDALTAGSY